jgi:DNA-binding NarL/FixJ family response regulator
VRAAAAELRDPAGLLLAASTAVAVGILRRDALFAIAAALAVISVKSLAAAVLTRREMNTGRPAMLDVSRRELEVARYIGLGLSNKEIAARLGRSERTVDSHVQNIMGKLGFHSRVQIAVWVAEHGLLDDGQKSAPK